MNNNGFSSVKIIGYEHNWIDAGAYPVTLVRNVFGLLVSPSQAIPDDFALQMQQASSAFAGVSFHCYQGSVSDQQTFYNAYPSKEIYFTECTGSLGSDWWSDIKVSLYSSLSLIILSPGRILHSGAWIICKCPFAFLVFQNCVNDLI